VVDVALAPQQLESMLRVAFLKAELEFLKTERRFINALEVVKTSTDFARLCELAETLLKESKRVNQSAKRLGQGSKHDR
jgi:hypothetical protein